MARNVITENTADYVNVTEQKRWTLPFEGLNPAGADDYVFYIKNTGTPVIRIVDITVSADTAATQVEVHGVTGTAANGSTLTPVQDTVQASATPTATIETGTDITGLTNDGTLGFIQCAVVNTSYSLGPKVGIRLTNGKAAAILIETGTANLTGTVTIIEEI